MFVQADFEGYAANQDTAGIDDGGQPPTGRAVPSSAGPGAQHWQRKPVSRACVTSFLCLVGKKW